VKVLIADDDHEYRSFIRRLLARDTDVDVVGEAMDGEQAVSLSERLKPDVVLMDLDMPRVDGLEATRRLKEGGGTTRVIIVSNLADEACRQAAAKCGADGFFLKSAEIAHLMSAIRQGFRRRKPLGCIET
jgi:DNA-binding NarL/FixJ family response regulator